MLELLPSIAPPLAVQLQCVVQQGKLLSKSYPFSFLCLTSLQLLSALKHHHLRGYHRPLHPPGVSLLLLLTSTIHLILLIHIASEHLHRAIHTPGRLLRPLPWLGPHA